jgi:hypothetical protein
VATSIAVPYPYDAGQFRGDLGSEAIDNTWEGVPNPVIIDWSLNISRFFLNLVAFKAHTEECALLQELNQLSF